MKYALLFLSVLLTACAAPRNAFESSPINDKALQASFNALYRSVTGKKGTKNSEFIAALSAYQQQETFNCRQPVFWRFFAEKNIVGAAKETCIEQLIFSIEAPFQEANLITVPVDRIREVHVVFAGKGSNFASRFGHIALRLIVCPSAQSSKEQCDENVFEHLILGFRAHIDEFSINHWKALNGKYAAYFFAQRFMDVYQEYAINEFRDISSIPLLLSAEQSQILARELSEVHWRYDGQYRFLSKNCVTLLHDLLRDTWWNSNNFIKKSNRPDYWFQHLLSSTLVDKSLLLPPTAEQQGYFFPSTEPYYQQALSLLNEQFTENWLHSLIAYVQENPLNRRQWLLDNNLQQLGRWQDTKLGQAALMLEEYAFFTLERLYTLHITQYFEQNKKAASLKKINEKLTQQEQEILQRCVTQEAYRVLVKREKYGEIPRHKPLSSNDTKAFCQQDTSAKQLLTVIKKLSTDDKQWLALEQIAHYWFETLQNISLLTNRSEL